MRKSAEIELTSNAITIVAAEPFEDERDRFACVIGVAVGIGMCAGMDTGEMIRHLQEILSLALEHNAEAIEAIRRGEPADFGAVDTNPERRRREG